MTNGNQSWTTALKRALVSGSAASLLSGATLVFLGRQRIGSAAAPINAISHWYHGERAARRDRPSIKYTLAGYLTHHVASIFWAIVLERAIPPQLRRTPAAAVASGAVLATFAAAVDYTITPKRFTPGYEKRLPVTSLIWVYGAFALGLALAQMGQTRLR
jgi:hypothetical protein